MGVIMQQRDQNTYIVTVAIVDKYGELVASKDLQHLMPPRKFVVKAQGGEEDDQRMKKAKMGWMEEVKEHEADKDKVMDLIQKHGVDLIVVGANKLEARQIKQVLTDIAEKLKNYGGPTDPDDPATLAKKSSKKHQQDQTDDARKEAFVIWGSLEIPKLFANSHMSTKLLKSAHPILKQAVSLARFEQDPLMEALNLWSFVPSEN